MAKLLRVSDATSLRKSTSVSTEICERVPEAEAADTLTLTDLDTTRTLLVQQPSQENRDAHVNYGMDGGLHEAMDHLDQIAMG